MKATAQSARMSGQSAGDPVMYWIGISVFAYCLIAFAGAAIINEQVRSFYTPLVILHAVLSQGWLLFFLIQARLATGSNLVKHRRFGKRSPILVAAMVLVGSVVMVTVYARINDAVLLFANVTIFANFLLFFIWALVAAKNRKVDWHKRLMLFATISLLGPAHGRFVRLFGLTDEYGGILSLSLPLILPIGYDLLSEGRIRKPTVILIGVSLAIMVVTIIGIVSIRSAS